MTQPTSKEINPLVEIEEQVGGGESLRYASDPAPDQVVQSQSLSLPALNVSDSYEGRCRQALLLAEEAFAKTGSWVVFFREVLGVDGVVARLFADPDDFKRFIAGPEFETLHEMLAAIRSQDQSKSDAVEPERMITIRIPRSLHESLQVESKACELSINKLAISKLLWPANPRFVPEQQGRRRGRRPGPQGKRGGAKTVPVSGPAEARPESSSRFSDDRRVVHSWADSQSNAAER